MTSRKGAESAKQATPDTGAPASSAAPSETARSKNLRALILPFSVASVCFVIGIAIAASAFLTAKKPDTPSPIAAPPIPASYSGNPLLELDLTSKSADLLAPLTVTLAEGDRLLISGRPGAALRTYTTLLEAQPNPTPELRFRIAVCGEMLGDLEHALREYQTLAQIPNRPHLALAAEMRQVFLLIQIERPELAKQILWTDLLDEQTGHAADRAGRADVAHALAQVLAAEAVAGSPRDLIDDQGILFPAFHPSLDDLILLLNQASGPNLEIDAANPTKEPAPAPGSQSRATRGAPVHLRAASTTTSAHTRPSDPYAIPAEGSVTRAAGSVTQAVAQANQASAQSNQASAHVTQASAHVTQASAHVTQASARVAQAEGSMIQKSAGMTPSQFQAQNPPLNRGFSVAQDAYPLVGRQSSTAQAEPRGKLPNLTRLVADVRPVGSDGGGEREPMPEEEREKIEGGEEPPEEETTESRPPHRRGVEITQRLSPRPDDIYLQIDLATLPIGALVETLAQQAELKVEWSPLARETVVGRQSRVAVAESSLAFLLDGLLDPLDLFWRTEGDRILVDAYETLSAEAVRSFRTTTAERALHHAIITFPDHGWVDEAYWSLGNLAFVTGRYAAAELHYQQHARQFPRIPGSVDIRFNLAKTLLALQQPVGALDNFYYVIDSGPEQPAAPAAYLYAGRLHTENDEPRRAVKPLMRAIALARDQNQRATATLAVATAYMLDDKPHAANQMLMEFREEIRDAKHLDQAAFLAAAARYRSARFDTQIEHEARALVMSLSHVKPGDFFGFGAHRLMVESQHDLQLFEDMHATLASSVATAGPGGMRDHLMFMLGRAENEAGRTAQAAEVFSALSGVGGEPWSSHADIELARLAIADRDTNAAFAACRRLLARAEPTVPIADTLRELGRTYELLGDHESAALCFSGAVPNALEHLPAGAALEPGVGDSTVPSEGSPASPIVDTPDSSAEAERGTAPANRSEGPPDANREKAPAVSDDGVADRRRFAPLPTTYRLTRLPTAGDTP